MKPLIKLCGIVVLALLCASPAWALQDMAPVTLHSSATTNTDGTVVDVSRYSSIGLDISITNTATVTFQSRSSSGGTYQSLQCMNMATGELVTTATSSMHVQCNVAGASQVKAPITGCSSCTVVVAGKISTAVSNGNGASVDGSGNANVNLATLGSGEDQTNNALMVEGAEVRTVSLMSGVSTNTTGTAASLSIGNKSVMGILTCNAGGSTDCGVTVTIYGSELNSQATGTFEQLCQAVIPTGTAVQHFTCSTITAPFPYIWAATTGIAGTSPSLNVTGAN